ncbi:hypothetical protein [Pseudomonas sp. GZD-222]|uniref:hypothetical protein n=1 Tax=Pseudomonas sp. GZD-222 TaxID=3404805 RepID=UPI003BB7B880
MPRNSTALFTLNAQNEAIQNQYGDDHFQIQDPLTGNFYTVSFVWNCSLAKKVYAQMYFLEGEISRGYADDKNRITVSSLSSARQEIAYLRDICEYWERVFPERTLQSLTRLELQQLFRYFLIKKHDNQDGREILGFSTMKMLSTIFDRMGFYLHSGKLVDGITLRINEAFRKSTMKPLLDPLGIEYAIWQKGGSYGSIPLTCASLMLAEAITLIESDEAKIAVIFFEQWRKRKTNIQMWFSNQDRLELYRRMQSPDYILTRFERDWAESARELGEAIDASTSSHFDRLPWSHVGKLGDFCQELSKATLAVIALLSGFRLVEIHGMKIHDYTQEPDGSWWFNSENNKTEAGFSHPRSLHGLAAEAATLMKNISAVDSLKLNLPLIHSGYRAGAFVLARGWGKLSAQEWLKDSGYSLPTLRKWFKEFYQNYVVQKYPEAGEIHSEVSPHQARHTFAEFALRRFDGNVLEKIREHFRHSYGSYHTRRYTRNKLSESVQISMERDYLKEVMGRVALGKIEDRFYGPAAKRIEIEMSRISVLSADEFEFELQELADQFVRFTAFEWGYCALRANEQHIAKCHDRETGTPNVDQRSGPEVCAGCPHSMNNTLQRMELERIKISHTFIAENHPLTVLRDMSFEVVKRIERRLDERVPA